MIRQLSGAGMPSLSLLQPKPQWSVARCLMVWKLRKLLVKASFTLAFSVVLALAGTAAISGFRGVGSVSGQSKAGSSQASAPADITVPTNTCHGSFVAYKSIHFAECPSFSLDFSKLPDGAISDKNFNVYTGKPEANQEAQLYTASHQNIKIKNGHLVISALNQPQNGYNYTSARINTKGKADFLYGKLVVRATLPKGTGTWPAIWMLPTDEKYKGMSPTDSANRDFSDGEIDIAEAVGTQPHTIYGIAHSVAHPADGRGDYFDTAVVPGNDTSFHDYELDWTPTSLTFMVDGTPFYTINKQAKADFRSWPYDQRYYLILNLAIGGTWGGTDRAHFPKDGVDPSSLPADMKIASINYYPYVK